MQGCGAGGAGDAPEALQVAHAGVLGVHPVPGPEVHTGLGAKGRCGKGVMGSHYDGWVILSGLNGMGQ